LNRTNVFVAASPEHYAEVEAVRFHISSLADIKTWPGVFKDRTPTVTDLDGQIDQYDLAVFLLGPDSVESQPDTALLSARDTILMAYGMFRARLGRDRCFVVHDRAGRPAVSSDFTYLSFAKPDTNAAESAIAALTPACDVLKRQVYAAGPRPAASEAPANASPATEARIVSDEVLEEVQQPQPIVDELPDPADSTLLRQMINLWPEIVTKVSDTHRIAAPFMRDTFPVAIKAGTVVILFSSRLYADKIEGNARAKEVLEETINAVMGAGKYQIRGIADSTPI